MQLAGLVEYEYDIPAELKASLISLVLKSFEAERKLKFEPQDFDAIVSNPDTFSKMSFYIFSKTSANEFMIRVHVDAFGSGTWFGGFYSIQEQNYSTGLLDEFEACRGQLDETVYLPIVQFWASPEYSSEIINEETYITDFDDALITFEDDVSLVV